jgi:hypothetical protein
MSSENRSIPVLLGALGIIGDIESISDCLAVGLSIFDENELLDSQPSLEQLLRIGINNESDRKRIHNFAIQEEDESENESAKEIVQYQFDFSMFD